MIKTKETKTYICDICNKEVPKFSYMMINIHYSNGVHKDGYETEGYNGTDVCKSCEASLKDWIDKRRRKK